MSKQVVQQQIKENRVVPLLMLYPHERNYKQHPPEQVKKLCASLERFGQGRSIVCQECANGSYTIVAGHGIVQAAEKLEWRELRADILPADWTPAQVNGYLVADNNLSNDAIDDDAILAALLQEQADAGYDLAALGSDEETLRQMLEALGDEYVVSGEQEDNEEDTQEPRQSLADRFIVPPFSVLDARQGYWQERKRAWLALGIQSELGRGDCITCPGDAVTEPGLNYYRNRTGNGKSPARSNGQDLMRGEHVVGQNYKTGKAQSLPTAPDGLMVIDHYRGRGEKTKNVKGLLGSSFPTIHPYDDHPEGGTVSQSGTSIFDPVLCELVYRWFSPPDGVVLDPFAGGSVRGIVAAKTGRQYVGVDLRAEQIAANEEQAKRICAGGSPLMLEASNISLDYTPEYTPIEEHGGYLVKRDDLFQIAGVRGGKVRTVWALAQSAHGLVTAGSRHSPHVHRVAAIAQRLGIPCRVHVASGENTPDVQGAEDAGAEVIKHQAGYLNVLIARAREDAQETGWTFIPFGVVCDEAVRQIKTQTANLPQEMKRLVMAVGSGVSLAGVLHGMKEHGIHTPVLGVCVGKDTIKTLDEYAPKNWRDTVELVQSPLKFEEHPKVTHLGELPLDPVYEAKCLPYLQDGDLLWSIGIRASATESAPHTTPVPLPQWIVGDSRNLGDFCFNVSADLVFTCPPYYDLEVYSDNPDDLSTASTYSEFLEDYRTILKQSIAQLKDNRFVCIVVGDIRDKRGFYRNFVSDTITACQDAGAKLYNEAILVTQVGSLPIRVGKQFTSGRKLGKTHQNVLIFCKGDPAKAVQACGPVVVEIPEDEQEDEIERVEEASHA